MPSATTGASGSPTAMAPTPTSARLTKATPRPSAAPGGTATCTAKAVCEDCKAEYGDLAAHNFTAEVVDAKYLKSAATCTAKAVYYKSCTFCGWKKGTETFETGNVLDHDWDEPSYTWTAVTDGYMCVASGSAKNCDADVSDIATVTYAVKSSADLPECRYRHIYGNVLCCVWLPRADQGRSPSRHRPYLGYGNVYMDADRDRLYLYRKARLRE